MLGMAIESYSPDGLPLPLGEAGELVCTRPFPCMPLGFWPLPGYGTEADVNAAQERFYHSYFAEFDSVWCESCGRSILCSMIKVYKFRRSWGSHYHRAFQVG